jgi:hexulose-6-phosphate isomerase
MIDGKIQSFPLEIWREEFALARDCGFELIEWVLNMTDLHHNPILSRSGRAEIVRLSKEYKINIPSICCDYFMEYSLISESLEERLIAQGMLIELIRVCPEAGIRFIEIPLIGKSSIEKVDDTKKIALFLNDIALIAKTNDVYLLLEVSLSPSQIASFLEWIPTDRIKLNYDTGNSAYWGYNPQEEISAYGHRIGNIHIKDCIPGVYSVPLGQGNVDFDLTFQLLKEVGYKGDFILQTARGEDDVQTAKTFYQFTQHYLQKYFQ